MEETRIVRMNSQLKGPGMLEQVVQGNIDAAKTMEELVSGNCISSKVLPDVLFASVVGASALREKQVRGENKPEIETARRSIHMLASTVAWKLSALNPEYSNSIHKRLIDSLRNCEATDANALNLLINTEMVFVGQKIVKNGLLIEIAEAITEGLSNAKDPLKRKMLFEFGRVIRARWPIELDKVYECVFDIVSTPKIRKEDSSIIILTALLRKEERGETGFGPIVEKRMRAVLDEKQKPLSDGDANLPKPRIKKTLLQYAKDILPFIRKPNQLAHARRN